MLVVRFTHPVGVPEVEAFGLPVQPTPVTLSAETVRALYGAYMDQLRSKWHADPSQRGAQDEEPPATLLESITASFRHVNNYFQDEFQRVARIVAEIDRASGGQGELELDDNVHLWWACSQLVFEKEFVLLGCPACGQDYSPSQCEVQEWSNDWLFGHRVICPASHNLYVCARSEYEPRGPCFVHWVPQSIHSTGRPPKPTAPHG